MEIRAIRPDDDFTAIGNIYVKSWQAGYCGIIPQDYLDALTPNHWSTVLQSGARDAYLLLDAAGRYIGTSSITPARDADMAGWGEIISIYLLSEYWGSGGAALLMEHVVARLAEQGFAGIYLWVLADNARAKRFYEKHGFYFSGREQYFTIAGVELAEQMYIIEL